LAPKRQPVATALMSPFTVRFQSGDVTGAGTIIVAVSLATVQAILHGEMLVSFAPHIGRSRSGALWFKSGHLFGM